MIAVTVIRQLYATKGSKEARTVFELRCLWLPPILFLPCRCSLDFALQFASVLACFAARMMWRAEGDL